MRYALLSLMVAFLIVGASFLDVEASDLMNYQGYLTDTQGDPVADGSYSIFFKIYDHETAGNILWVSDRINVQVSEGLFSCQLGPFPDGMFVTDSTLWLGITVGSDPEIDPRTRLSTAPFAFSAKSMDGDIETSEGAVVLKNGSGDSAILIDAGDDRAHPPEIIFYDINSSPKSPFIQLVADPSGGPSIDFFDEAGKVMGVEPSPWNEGFSLRLKDPGDDANLLEISANHLTDETKIRFVHPPEKDVITINSVPSSGASIKMFNPQPEPPAVLFELNASETEGASMDFFDDAGKVMGVEPSPFNEGFSIKMIDPGDDENLLEISANHLTDETKIRFVHPPEKDVITINSLPSTGASIKMFNPQSEPQTLLMDIAASYAGVKAGTAVISLYDDNNDLESHLEPGKISLEASTEGPPIILEVDPFELEARIGIGNSDPTANLVVGNNLGSFGGTRIIIGGTDPGTESGVVIGEDNDNRAWILWNVDNNTLGMGTKQNGAAFGSTIVLDSGRVGIGTASPGEELHVVGDICYTGSIGACSDARYKKDISTLSGALDRVASLRGVTFHWRCEDFPQNKFSDDEQVGLIAQEVNEVFPQIVTQTDKGYYNIDYARLTPLLVEAIKELRAENEDLKQRIENLEQLVE